jgi:hypothetical protein
MNIIRADWNISCKNGKLLKFNSNLSFFICLIDRWTLLVQIL